MARPQKKLPQSIRLLVTGLFAIVAYEFKYTSDWFSTNDSNLNEWISPTIAGNTDGDNYNHNNNEEAYLEWLLEERNNTPSSVQLVIHYRCQSGLGHQLLRFSAAYHLAMLYQIPFIWPTSNPMCGENIFSIHNYLLGPHPPELLKGVPLFVDVPYFDSAHDHHRRENLFHNRSLFPLPGTFPNLAFVNETTVSDERKKSFKRYLSINNEVTGYSKGQIGYMHMGTRLDEMIQNNFWGKESSDFQLYEQMMLLFSHQHASTIQAAMEHTNFTQHTVFRFHIRAGNGEHGDFESKHRGMGNLDEWIRNAMVLLCEYAAEHSSYFYEKPLMIFVGTDTASVIPKLQAASDDICQIPITSAPQVYPEDGSGVSFMEFATGDKEKLGNCLNGWRDMFLDMYMFTQCNTVVAGTYSSFTQSAPLSNVMHKAKLHNHLLANNTSFGVGFHPHYFCEMGTTGKRMDCYDTLSSWLRRNDAMVSLGDLDSSKQKVRHEVMYPDPVSGPKMFQGTALMAATESRA